MYAIKHEVGTFYFEERGEGKWTLDESQAKQFTHEADAQSKIDGRSVKNFLNRMEERIKIREIRECYKL